MVHTAGFINQVMALIKPLIRSEMFALLKFTSQGPLDFLDKDLLPKDYGGTLDTIESYYKPERILLETEYRNWLIDSAALKEKRDESRKNEKQKQEAPLATSFSGLEID